MENNKEDLEKKLETPVITDDMEITQPMAVVKENGVNIDGESKETKNFEAFKNFIKTDMRTKEEMIDIAPEELDDYDELARIEYSDKLDAALKGMEIDLKMVSEGFEFGGIVDAALKKFFEATKEKLAVGKYENGIGNKMYRDTISDMRPEFVEEVKDNCVGYTGASSELLAELIGKSKTVNEVLHAMHSYIMNNEEIMENMPKIDEKKNSSKYPINLYGEMSPVAQKIFENFPLDMDVGFTDIISMKDRVFMMVRDRGHALTIDMDTKDQDEIGVKYFVPKLCNEEMINALRGIDKSSITPNGARGSFTAKSEAITEELFGFIEKVPTDMDIPAVREWYNQRLEEERLSSMNEEEQKVNETENVKETGEKTIQEQIVEPITPIFSMEDAKSIAVEPERRMGRIESFQKAVAKIFNPLINKFKGKESPEVESNIEDRNVDDKNGREI